MYVMGLCLQQCEHKWAVTYVIKWVWVPTTAISLARKVASDTSSGRRHSSCYGDT